MLLRRWRHKEWRSWIGSIYYNVVPSLTTLSSITNEVMNPTISVAALSSTVNEVMNPTMPSLTTASTITNVESFTSMTSFSVTKTFTSSG